MSRNFKKYFLFFLMILSTFFNFGKTSFAQEMSQNISLNLSDENLSSWCAARPLQGLKLSWDGVEEKRGSLAVGELSKKSGESQVILMATPSLVQTLEASFLKILPACGLEWVAVSQGETPKLKVFVDQFRASDQKALVTSKGKALSALSLVISSPQKKVSIRVGYEMEFKRGRKSGTKRLQEVVQELFQNTLHQVVLSPEWQNLRGGH